MAFLLLVPPYLTVPNNLKSVIDNRDTMVQLLKRKKHTHLSFYYSYTQNPFEKKEKRKKKTNLKIIRRLVDFIFCFSTRAALPTSDILDLAPLEGPATQRPSSTLVVNLKH